MPRARRTGRAPVVGESEAFGLRSLEEFDHGLHAFGAEWCPEHVGLGLLDGTAGHETQDGVQHEVREEVLEVERAPGPDHEPQEQEDERGKSDELKEELIGQI